MFSENPLAETIMNKTIALPFALLALGACSTGPQQNVYSSYEVGMAKSVERCRVLGVRNITIQGETGRAIGQFGGALTGSVAGALIGDQIGKGSGRDVATVLGGMVAGLAGGAIGSSIGARIDQRPGVEYSILETGGREITFAQEILPGDRIVAAGETCRIQTDPYGGNRILPVEGLPQQVQRPQQTTFY